MKKVLFVCHGNICRSPMAEAVFRHMLEERGLGERFAVDSAAVSAAHRIPVGDGLGREEDQRVGTCQMFLA